MEQILAELNDLEMFFQAMKRIHKAQGRLFCFCVCGSFERRDLLEWFMEHHLTSEEIETVLMMAFTDNSGAISGPKEGMHMVAVYRESKSHCPKHPIFGEEDSCGANLYQQIIDSIKQVLNNRNPR